MFIKHYLLHFGPLFYHLVSSSLHWPFPSKIQHSSFSIANLPIRRPCGKTCLQATFQGLSISHHPRLVHRPPSKASPQATTQGLSTGHHSKTCPWATIKGLSTGHHSRACPQATILGLSSSHHSKACPKATIPRLVCRTPSKVCPQATILKRVVHRPPTKKGLPTAYLYWLAIPWIKCDKLVVIDTCIPCHVISITFMNYCAKK